MALGSQSSDKRVDFTPTPHPPIRVNYIEISECQLVSKGCTRTDLNDFPAPPNEEDLQRMSVSATLETVAGGEGFYRSFDDLDDIDDHLMSVLADSNPIEAAVVLRGENLSQNGNGRNSFNSSDSGRMSDTYAETSNSSVTSSSTGSLILLHFYCLLD